MSQSGLQPFDLRLDAFKAGVDYFAVLTVHQPGGGTTRRDVDLFDFQQTLDLSRRVLDRVEQLVDGGRLRRDALAEPELQSHLDALNAALFAIRLTTSGETLREVFRRVLDTDRPPAILVGGAMRLVPWELTTPDYVQGPDGFLGSRAHITGSTDPEPGASRVDGTAVYRPRRRTNVLGVGDAVRLRAIGNMALDDAAAEARLVRAPNGITTGVVAPTLNPGAAKAPFFNHFGLTGYELVHVFAHCDYDAAGFALAVSDDVDLNRGDFDRHEVMFPGGAFHFLNVCCGAPTPTTQTFSFLEYMARQQMAGGVLASLTSVRSAAAVAMATEFYRAFLPGRPDVYGASAAEALLQARRALWDQDEAAGYLYRTFGRQDTVLGPLAKLLEAENV